MNFKRPSLKWLSNGFVSSGSTGIPLLTDVRVPTAQMHGDVLAQVAAESSAVTVDDYDAAIDVLADKKLQLADAEVDLEQHQVDLLQLQKEAEDEVVRLREIEDERLSDEAVQAALAAMQLEQARQYEELQRRQAEAARTADDQAGNSVASAANPAVATGLVQGMNHRQSRCQRRRRRRSYRRRRRRQRPTGRR